MSENKKLVDMSTKEIAQWFSQWRQDRDVELQYVVGKPLSDMSILIPLVKSTIADVSVTMNVVSILLDRLGEEEASVAK